MPGREGPRAGSELAVGLQVMVMTPQDANLRKLLAAEPIPTLARRAASLGVEVHLVGGAVRDHLLGRESHDFDTVVSHRGRELAEGVARDLGARFVPLGGKEFASFRVVAGGSGGEEGGEAAGPAWELDVWDREGGALEADLARRDFTVNAIALAVGEGGRAAFVDPFGGIDDLEHRRLRATTGESFSGDPLRVLRLPRFLVQLPGFEADPETVALARRSVSGLARVAAERIRDELALILRHERAHRGVAALMEVGVYPGLWLSPPGAAEENGAAASEGGEDPSERGAIDEAGTSRAGEGETRPSEELAVEEGPVERAGRAVGEVARLGERAAEMATLAPGAPPVDLPAGRWTLTFAALGPPAGLGHPGRPVEGAASDPAILVERFRDAGYVTRDLAARITKLVAEPEIPPDERGRRRFLHRLGDAWPTAVARLGAACVEEKGGGEGALADWRRDVRELAALLSADGERILTPPRLLSGEDVQRLLGVAPGPQVGQALDRVRRAQVDGEIATREEAERLLRGD